ncbi:hypothetical protein [Actinomadura sp. 9N407]|uniref:hypothetical protein n=1 Tax=Actinomadura sp. 9N407 TaxID=3375154 RepID=UPI0037AE05D3
MEEIMRAVCGDGDFKFELAEFNGEGDHAPGALSTVMAFAASEEPKKNAFQLVAPACTAAE